MSIPSKQIGQSAESNLLWQISKQLEWINNTTGYNTSTFVPYVGATSAVNLGTQTLSSGHIDVGYDLTTSVPFTYDALHVYGQSTFAGTLGNDGAVFSDDLLTVGSGTGWTGTDFASGYTHVTGNTPLVATLATSNYNGFYELSYTISDRTTGFIQINIGNSLYGSNISESGALTGYANSYPSFITLSITPYSGFNGTIQATLTYIYQSYPLMSMVDISSNVVNEIRIGGYNTYNFIMGANAGILLGGSSEFGFYNYCSGTGAGELITKGQENTAIGIFAGKYTSTGSRNIAIGSGSYNQRQAGNDTIAIGAIVNGDNIIAIGGGNEISNSTVIGNSLIESATIYGNLLLGGTVDVNATLNVTGPSLQNGTILFAQPTPIAKTVGATLLISELLTGIITVTSATAVSLALPSATLTNAGILGGLMPIDTAFEWVVINRGSSVGIVTITNGSGNTIFGLATIPITSQAIFRTRKTATNTFVTYRIA